MTQEITVYKPVEAALADLSSRYKGLVFDVVNPDGMQQAKAAYKDINSYSVTLEKARTTEKAESLAYGRRVDSEAKRIADQLDALRLPIKNQIEAETKRAEREREEKMQAELARLDAEERAKKAAEEKRLADERAAIAAERATLEVERKAREEEERKRREAIKAEERAAKARIDALEREAREARDRADREAREAREAKERELKAIQDRIDAEARKEREVAETKAAAERRAKEVESLIRTMRERIEGSIRHAGIARAIDAYWAIEQKAA